MCSTTELPPGSENTIPTPPLGVSIAYYSSIAHSGGGSGFHVLRATRAGAQYHKATVGGWNLRKRAHHHGIVRSIQSSHLPPLLSRGVASLALRE